MASSLDLDPEWGAIDLLEEIEVTFGIEIANKDAERCSTVGDLYDILCALSPDWEDQTGRCGSSMVFYMLRRSLNPEDKRLVRPDTLLTAIGLQPTLLFSVLAKGTGLRLPAYEPTSLGKAGGFLISAGIIGSVVTLLTGHWRISGIVAPVSLAGIPLLRLDPGRFPKGMLTVADLVRRTVPLNVASLKEAGVRLGDRWSILVALAAEHGELSPAEIDPDTFFHRRSLELATAS